MLADFVIPRLSDDVKIAIQKHHEEGQFCTEVWTLLKKRRPRCKSFFLKILGKILPLFCRAVLTTSNSGFLLVGYKI